MANDNLEDVVLEDDQLKQMGDMDIYTPPTEDIVEEDNLIKHMEGEGNPPIEPIPPKTEPPIEDNIEPPVEPVGEPPIEPPIEEDPIKKLEKENEELRAAMEQVLKDVSIQPKPKEKTPEEVKAEEEAKKNKGPVVLPFFKSDADIDNAFKDVDSANKFVTSIVATAVEIIGKQIPNIASRIADQQLTVRMAAKEFFDNNKDLEKYKEYCGFMANKLAAENPEWTMSKLMEEVSKKTREALKVKAQMGNTSAFTPNNTGGAGGNNPPQKQKSPALPPSSGGGRKSGPGQLTGLEKELSDMFNATEF